MEPIKPRNRARYDFEFPKDIADDIGISKIAIMELSPNDEIRAAKRSENDAYTLVQELAKEAIKEVDGRPVSTGDETCDIVWSQLGPVGRSLVMNAVQALSQPEKDTLKSFLNSRKVTVV